MEINTICHLNYLFTKGSFLFGRSTAIFALIIIPILIAAYQLLAFYLPKGLQFLNFFYLYQGGLLGLAFFFVVVLYPLLSIWRFYRPDDFRGLVHEYEFIKNVVVVTFFVSLGISFFTIYFAQDTGENHIYDIYTNNESTSSSAIVPFIPNGSVHSQSAVEICKKLAHSGLTSEPYCLTITPLIETASYIQNSILFQSISALPIMIFYAGLLKMLSFFVRKDFKFYFAKGCFNIGLSKKDEVDKMKYVSLGLKTYNKYLGKRLDLNIKDLSTILVKIGYLKNDQKDEVIKSLCSAFNEGKLQPIRYLVSLSSYDADHFLTQEIIRPITEIIKEYGLWLATLIPVVIGIVQFTLHPSK